MKATEAQKKSIAAEKEKIEKINTEDDMKFVLEDIESAAQSGRFTTISKYWLHPQTIKALRKLGYKVAFYNFSLDKPAKERERMGYPFFYGYKISWIPSK